MTPVILPWIILLAPLAAAVVITLFTQRSRDVSATLSITAVLGGFILAVLYVCWAGWDPAIADSSCTWLEAPGLKIELGIHLSRLSVLMMLVVTGVASAIHIYSLGYMSEDEGFSRFFACLSLFTFSMLGIVLANNFVELFMFWELVGVSSYLLIGHWYGRASAADAAKKAFITNRLGDFGFLLGILTVWGVLHTVNFGELQALLEKQPNALGHLATAAGLLIFCGAVGKSAQFPLHVWLPDAMEGPTPVSALIHAATMVAAGVYMLCRVFFLLSVPGSEVLTVIALVGAFTALLAALLALQQDDIKRILAYSTLSQLGYMVMAVGLSGQTEAMFHLTTHAFFKALLFLGAGSVIVALHHEQDIWKMGGLRQRMPVTFWTFLAGTLAIAGVWPLSGFFSKDSILAMALHNPSPVLRTVCFATGIVVAALTTFYMFRLVLTVFGGSPRSELAGHAGETSRVMIWPLRVLAVFSVVGGVIGIEPVYRTEFGHEAQAQGHGLWQQLVLPFSAAPWAAAFGLLAVVIGLWGAYALYRRALTDPLPGRLGIVADWLRHRLYFDELYQATVIRFHDWLAAVADWCDRRLIAGFAVRGTHGTVELLGRALRLVQTGNLQTYAFLFALGVALVLYLALR